MYLAYLAFRQRSQSCPPGAASWGAAAFACRFACGLGTRSRRTHGLGISDQVADDVDSVALRKSGTRFDAHTEPGVPKRSRIESVVRDEPGAAHCIGNARIRREFHRDNVLHVRCCPNHVHDHEGLAQISSACQALVASGTHFLRRGMTRLLECAARSEFPLAKS